MKRSGILSLLEQCVMLLVFALAAALCLKGFLAAELTARENGQRDSAVLLAQNAAEQLKHHRGAWEPSGDCGQTQGLLLTVERLDTGLEFLGKAQVSVSDTAGNVLVTVPAAWQEVERDEG